MFDPLSEMVWLPFLLGQLYEMSLLLQAGLNHSQRVIYGACVKRMGY